VRNVPGGYFLTGVRSGVRVGHVPARVRNLLLIALVAGCWQAPAAAGATQIGQTFAGGDVDCLEFVVMQAATVGPDPSYAVPAGGGVITSWGHEAGAGLGKSLALLAMRPSGGIHVVAGSSGVQPLAPSQLNIFGARIPVQGGELLAVWNGPNVEGCGKMIGVPPGDVFKTEGPITTEPVAGNAFTLPGEYLGHLLNVSANVEPDADKDGFGDESQDQCPTDASAQGVCPPPAVKDGKAPGAQLGGAKTQSLKKGVVKVSVEADEDSTATASGTLSVPGAARSFKLRGASATLKAKTKATLSLKIGKKARRVAARALRNGRKVRAKVGIEVRDAAGNKVEVKRVVRVRG
jgi:hypothetical protein